jgi:hypothetical protein
MFWTLKFRSEKLQEMASAQVIPLQRTIPSIEQGWVGKQKTYLMLSTCDTDKIQ